MSEMWTLGWVSLIIYTVEFYSGNYWYIMPTQVIKTKDNPGSFTSVQGSASTRYHLKSWVGFTSSWLMLWCYLVHWDYHYYYQALPQPCQTMFHSSSIKKWHSHLPSKLLLLSTRKSKWLLWYIILGKLFDILFYLIWPNICMHEIRNKL